MNKIYVSTKLATHYATQWADAEKYPALPKLGCKQPEPIIDPHPPLDPDSEQQLIVRCAVTGLVFTVAESRGEHWIPGPDEVIARRNAIRERWSDDERNSRDVTQGATIQDREDAKRCTIPMISTQGWDRERKRLSSD